MLADRLQLMVLCQTGPRIPTAAARPLWWLSTCSEVFWPPLPSPQFPTAREVPQALRSWRRQTTTPQLLAAAEGSGQGWGLEQATTTRGLFRCFGTILLQDQVSIAVRVRVLHADTLSLPSSPSTEHSPLCKAQNHAEQIYNLVQHLLS